MMDLNGVIVTVLACTLVLFVPVLVFGIVIIIHLDEILAVLERDEHRKMSVPERIDDWSNLP
jgi:hypothetical protein